MKIDEILDKVYKLPDQAKQKIIESIDEVNYKKGEILFQADKIVQEIYFIKKGIVRAYTKTSDNDITFWFGKEGDTVISMRSYVANNKGYEDIEVLEDSEFYKVDISYLRKLFKEDIHIANWGRKFAEQELIKTEKRLISRQFRTAKDRYKELIENNPDLIRRVQLGHIASYLGITQVSLSRIRAEKN
ncbi:Crp/Fnr family transcriptional regulator [Gramella lutea]|uniref:Crp/Fnr family transcriptional regulator n=1 Tax=Christiangramia lutea TaxID=1607951 RepID=A0A9X1V7W3_9FLAO|nr:Crp/Fnr family transcriptional regulator [Christiangramia lutea]MCH4824654.1 Crp/Fnr family transcriptional regulator [Christiangramia lutea]